MTDNEAASAPLEMTKRKLGKRDGLRWSITWLHRRAQSMNDPRAKAILNSAAFSLGNEIREGRWPPIANDDRDGGWNAAIAAQPPAPRRSALDEAAAILAAQPPSRAMELHCDSIVSSAPPQPGDEDRLARLRKQRDDAPIRYNDGTALVPMVNFQWIEVDFLFQQLDAAQSALAEKEKALADIVAESTRRLAWWSASQSALADMRDARDAWQAVAGRHREDWQKVQSALAASQAEVARLKAEAQQESPDDGWQPISEYPVDAEGWGPNALLFVPTGQVAPASDYRIMTGRLEADFWLNWNDAGAMGDIEGRPTKWRPLPALPDDGGRG